MSRRDPNRRRLAVGLVAGLLIVVLLVSVAGGPVGGPDAAPSPSTTSTAVTIPIAPEDRPFCEAFGALLNGPLSDPATDTGDPVAVAAAVAATEVVLDQLAATAPDELTEPVATLAVQFRAAFELFERYDFDVNRVLVEATPEEQEVLDAFGTSGTDADDAMVPIEAFVVERCSTEVLPDLDE